MCLNPGDVIGEHYQIIRLLGQGGFANSYLVSDNSYTPARLCVAKEIIPKSQNPDILKKVAYRFENEAQALEKLGKHPHIPSFIDKLNENNHFYLIQEYIEGDDLVHEIIPDEPWSQEQVRDLLEEILEILDFIHNNKVIHRDLKPSNLIRRKQDNKLVLIDFGAVKEISSLSLDDSGSPQTIAIGTIGYMPPEQGHGIPQYNSDIYALGIIAIQALTGLPPHNLKQIGQTGDIKWRSWANVSDRLGDVLDRMICYDFQDRYQSAREVLDDLPSAVELVRLKKYQKQQKTFKAIKNLINTRILPITSIFVLFYLIIAGLIYYKRSLTCPKITGDNLSCGEEILTRTQFSQESSGKKQGAIAFQQGKYQEALTLFQEARKQNPEDPETLIYINNAILALNKTKTYTIAVAAPLGDSLYSADTGKEILRGVAQAQTEFNQNPQVQGFGLRILIIDDFDKTDVISEIAKKIGKQPEILAVIGHSNSDTTLNSIQTYQKYKLVLISATSTAEILSNRSDFFFRSVPQDRVNGQALAQYLAKNAQQKRVLVLYNSKSEYSKSISSSFQKSFAALKGQIVQNIDLADPDFDENKIFEDAKKQSVTALVLFPEAKASSQAFLSVLKVIGNNQGRYLLAGGDSLYNQDILKRQVQGLIMAIPWFELNPQYQQFRLQNQELFQSPVSWRTAMSYDAARVITTVLEQEPPRNNAQLFLSWFNPSLERLKFWKILHNSNFKATGATPKITFTPSGDRREEIVDLIKIVPFNCADYKYTFIPVTAPNPETVGLKCMK